MTEPSAATSTPVGTDDYVAVQRLIHRYADAVVNRNGERWGSCWADEASWDLGGGRLVHGKDAILALWYSAMKGMAAVVQLVHNGEVWAVDGDVDRATGRWYIDERFQRADGTRNILLANYDDEYVRIDGHWLFARRYLEVHYMGAPELTDDFRSTQSALVARGVAADV